MKKAIIKKSISPIYETNIKNEKKLSDEGLYGTCVDILDEYESFYKIKTFYDYEGYINKNNLEIREDRILLWNSKKKFMINNNYINVNEKPDIKSKIIFSLVRGEVVTVEENNNYNNWVKVNLVNTKKGYIRKEFLKSINNKKTLQEDKFRENIVNTSLLYLNTQYKWGGKSSLGIDCSGLCFMVYLLNFIIINRDSYLKDKFPIKEINIKYMKKGDLIFFPGHVGIYIGDKKYIHSSSFNSIVSINSLDKKSTLYNDKFCKSIKKIGSIFYENKDINYNGFKI